MKRIAASLLAIALATPVAAHDPGLSSSRVWVGAQSIVAKLCFNNQDLASTLQLDRNADGSADATELESGRAKLDEFVQRAVRIAGLTPTLVAFGIGEESDIVLELSTPGIPAATSFRFELTAFDELPRGHRHFVGVLDSSQRPVGRKLLHARSTALQVEAGATARDGLSIVTEFTVLGIEHILIGINHILFLLGLLIAAPRLLDAAKLITAFTVGHSVTLALATLGVMTPPTSLVEPIIALSVLFVAAENLFARTPRHRWKLTLAFGLIHGFGFASVLAELGIDDVLGIAEPLVSFNAGVEIGQLAIAACIVPLLLKLRRTDWFVRFAQPGVNIAVAACGAYWLFDRTLGG